MWRNKNYKWSSMAPIGLKTRKILNFSYAIPLKQVEIKLSPGHVRYLMYVYLKDLKVKSNAYVSPE